MPTQILLSESISVPPLSKPPKAFISYSWDSESHRIWVRELATRLQSKGVDVTLDQWAIGPGDQLPKFMEASIRENDFVLVVCTAGYKRRSDLRQGGVGYEGDVMTAEVLSSKNDRKFIPVLREQRWEDAAPSWLLGKYYVDLRGDPWSSPSFDDLVSTLLGQRQQAPPLVAGKPSQDYHALQALLATGEEHELMSFLASHAHLLARCVAAKDTSVHRKVDLHKHEVDFAIGYNWGTTGTTEWTLVKVGRATDHIFDSGGEVSEALSRALGAVLSWRGWIQSNLTYARTILRDVSPFVPVIIFMGRREMLSAADKERLQVLCTNHVHLRVHTFDRLLENC